MSMAVTAISQDTVPVNLKYRHFPERFSIVPNRSQLAVPGLGQSTIGWMMVNKKAAPQMTIEAQKYRVRCTLIYAYGGLWNLNWARKQNLTQ